MSQNRLIPHNHPWWSFTGYFFTALVVANANSETPCWGATVSNVMVMSMPDPIQPGITLIRATFCLRQAPQGGVMGGEVVTLTVNFWEDDTWPNPNDPIGAAMVNVTLPMSGEKTGPFTTPYVAFQDADLGNGEPADYRATVKAGPGVGGGFFGLLGAAAGGAESDVALARLAPSEAVRQNPSFDVHFGNSVAIVGLSKDGRLSIHMEQADDVPSVPRLPTTGLGYEIYQATIQGEKNTLSFQFPTADVPNDEFATIDDDLTFDGFPVFEWADVSTLGQFDMNTISVSIIDADGILEPFTILVSEPSAAGDINFDGRVDRLDAATFARFFGQQAHSTWTTGDFDNDRATTLADWALLQMNFGQSAPRPAALAAVPEPCSFVLVALGAMMAMVYRRGRRR